MTPDYHPLSLSNKLATVQVVRFFYSIMFLQVSYLYDYQGEMLRYIGDLLIACQSLPSYVHLWIVSTIEQLLVLLSLVLNAYVCILFVKTWKWPRTPVKVVDDEILASIEIFLVEHSKTLSEDDIVSDNSDTNEEAPRWNIPKPGEKVSDTAVISDSNNDNDNNNQATRSIAGECVICYYHYRPGDTVTWSGNPNCIHSYHTHCVEAWLLPWEERNQLCPCCRQSYCCEEVKCATTEETDTSALIA